MNYTVYDPISGQILENLSLSDPTAVAINLANKFYVNGYFPGNQYYVDVNTLEIVNLPANPNNASTVYVFDWITHQWQYDESATAQRARAKRETLLISVDRVNPLWFASLTEEQLSELTNYRQALLDVPNQPGFPQSINWPVKPNWMA